MSSTSSRPKFLSSAELRALFLEFFRQNGHTIVPSSSLVPGNDPTLLFTNAGMVQFKDVFLGKDRRSYVRAASSQRCVRAGGKHNDLENVGYTARHHTFFEMLGNFSFGDYFKRDAIRFAWEFVTGSQWLGVDPRRLMVTVYHTDDEAFDIWHKVAGVPADRIVRIGDKPGGGSDNFWQMGETGPCGPCTEIFYDHGAEIPGGPPGSADADGDRWIEIWNLVFMQFDRSADGTLTALPKPSVDTGMGLERVAAVMQGVHSNYEIDLFQGLIRSAAEATGTNDLSSSSLRVIADHIRACSFLIADGVLPSNEGRGYVLRRIIRRAIRHGYKLECRDPFFYQLVPTVVSEMGDAYPELISSQRRVMEVLLKEEESFFDTIESGMHLLEGWLTSRMYAINWAEHQFQLIRNSGGNISFESDDKKFFPDLLSTDHTVVADVYDATDIRTQGDLTRHLQWLNEYGTKEGIRKFVVVVYEPSGRVPTQVKALLDAADFPREYCVVAEDDLAPYKILPGDVAFRLHDTYGFSLDLTADVCRERGVSVDTKGFENAMEAQRERARAASKFGSGQLTATTSAPLGRGFVTASKHFIGYEALSHQTNVVALFRGAQPVDTLQVGEEGTVILYETPFYAESGGQVGDAGQLIANAARFEVSDTQKLGLAHAHLGRLALGGLKVGDRVQAQVDAERRRAIMLNHSATHLLHAALRRVLGAHVTQKGSLVAPDRLRFDFSHYSAVTPEQLQEVERLVNAEIRSNAAAEIQLMEQEAAIAAGAMALFGEKYEDEVRVLRIGDFSMELCGGTHVSRAGDIGLFKIVSESGVAAGIRRIEAVTGQGALDWIAATEQAMRSIATAVKAGRDDVEEKIRQLLERSRKLEKEVAQLKSKLASGQGGDLSATAIDVAGVKVVAARMDGADAATLRNAIDQLKNKLKSAAVVLASVESDTKILLIAGVTQDQTARLKAGDLVNFVAQQVGGRGGGRADLAQAGGTNPAALDDALTAVKAWVEERLSAR